MQVFICRRKCNWPSLPATTEHDTSRCDRAIANTAMLSFQHWQHYELCGFSPLQTQFPMCLFSQVSIQNDKLRGVLSFLKPLRWARWSFHRTAEAKCTLVICVWARWRNAAFLTGVFGVRVCSVSPLFVWVCQSPCRVLRSHVDWLTNLSTWAWFRLTGQISASELVYCSPDEPKVHEDGGYGWVTFGTCY